jgi:hypothetical protein
MAKTETLKPKSNAEWLAALMWQELEKDHWGLIEPGVFYNVAKGLTTVEDITNQGSFDKIEPEEADADAVSMRRVLTNVAKKFIAELRRREQKEHR